MDLSTLGLSDSEMAEAFGRRKAFDLLRAAIAENSGMRLTQCQTRAIRECAAERDLTVRQTLKRVIEAGLSNLGCRL